MTTETLLDAHVRGYAQAVRLHLADLGPDVVEDLTDGLDADLADALADRLPPAPDDGDDVVLDLAVVFGPAAQYAADLRAAAGLPQAAPARRRGRTRERLAAASRSARDTWARAWAPVTSTAGWASLRGALGDLTPVWWVARGWVLGSAAAALIDGSAFSLVPVAPSDLVTQLVAVAISVQWARGRWMPWRWMPRLATVASVLAIVVALPLAAQTRDRFVHTAGSGDGGYSQGWNDGFASSQVGLGSGLGPGQGDGVWVDGMQISNLFAYDAQGLPLRDVQIFDDRGRPVRTVTRDAQDSEWAVPDVDGQWIFRPGLATDGRERWNVYPLRAFASTDMAFDEKTGEFGPVVGARPQTMPWPFLQAPTVIADERTPGEKAPADDAPDAPREADQPEAEQTPPAPTPSAPTASDSSAQASPAAGAGAQEREQGASEVATR
ncbi:hypothetical protein [Xylanimonas ulmi]|uniref:Uncharacterized protein n=1 Tax=Xylanimonas ulmi TaxID=228973 RepID=A0A4V2EY57_9MICO|nr:hypothetical protein [Xylanibacterium ulmi]RZS61830.1 hypothetical protein EV386_2142 [Xylanibacterium ulmi]